MTFLGIAAIMDGMKTQMLTSTRLAVAYRAGEDGFPENIPETPLLLLYPESGGNAVLTFGAAAQEEDIIFLADLYAKARGFLPDALQEFVLSLDAMLLVLETEKQAHPPFGVAGVQWFDFSWERVTIEHAQQTFAGIRFTLVVKVF